MDALWTDMGFIRWPLTLSLLVILGLASWSAVKLYRPGAYPDLRTKAWLDGILFWGGFAVIAGVMGTLIGITVMARSVEVAGELSTSLLWGGIKVSMLSSVFGILILILASLLWFGLQLRWRLLVADEAEG